MLCSERQRQKLDYRKMSSIYKKSFLIKSHTLLENKYAEVFRFALPCPEWHIGRCSELPHAWGMRLPSHPRTIYLILFQPPHEWGMRRCIRHTNIAASRFQPPHAWGMRLYLRVSFPSYSGFQPPHVWGMRPREETYRMTTEVFQPPHVWGMRPGAQAAALAR